MQEFIADTSWGLLLCSWERAPQRGGEDSLGDDTRRRRTTMNRKGLWAACVVLILLVVGAGALTTVGAGYAKDEDTARAKCSKATLDGTYLFAFNGVEIRGNDEQVPFAFAGYAVFDGNGKEKGVASSNFKGEVTRNEPVSATYTVKADCTGTVTYRDGSQIDVFIAPDGRMFTFVQTKPSKLVGSGFEPRGTAKRVGD
jgi:hypothetical protein